MAFSAFGGPSPSSLHGAGRDKNAILVEAARRLSSRARGG